MNSLSFYICYFRKIPEKQLSHYMRWIGRYRYYCQQHSKKLFSFETRMDFVSYLLKNHQEWQVFQADDAVGLFLTYLTVQQATSQARQQEKTKEDESYHPELQILQQKNAAETSELTDAKAEALVDKIMQSGKSHTTAMTYIRWLSRYRAHLDQIQGDSNADNQESLSRNHNWQEYIHHLSTEPGMSQSAIRQARSALKQIFTAYTEVV